MLHFPSDGRKRNNHEFGLFCNHFISAAGQGFEIGNVHIFAVVKNISQAFRAMVFEFYRRDFNAFDIKG